MFFTQRKTIFLLLTINWKPNVSTMASLRKPPFATFISKNVLIHYIHKTSECNTHFKRKRNTCQVLSFENVDTEVAISKIILHKINYSANIKHNHLVSLKHCNINMFYRKLTQLHP